MSSRQYCRCFNHYTGAVRSGDKMVRGGGEVEQNDWLVSRTVPCIVSQHSLTLFISSGCTFVLRVTELVNTGELVSLVCSCSFCPSPQIGTGDGELIDGLRSSEDSSIREIKVNGQDGARTQGRALLQIVRQSRFYKRIFSIAVEAWMSERSE